LSDRRPLGVEVLEGSQTSTESINVFGGEDNIGIGRVASDFLGRHFEWVCDVKSVFSRLETLRKEKD
jgi:hypothetical protein